MKNREWIRPRGMVQVFEANEYVGACYTFTTVTPVDHLYIDQDRSGNYNSGDHYADADKYYAAAGQVLHYTDENKPTIYPAYTDHDSWYNDRTYSGTEYQIWSTAQYYGCNSSTKVYVSTNGLVLDADRPLHS